MNVPSPWLRNSWPGNGIVVVGFVADVEVEVAVVVVVGPGRGLRRVVDGRQAGREGHVGERAVAVVVQQRVGMPPVAAEPAAAQDQDVGGAVVVVVGLDEVEPAVEAVESGLLAAVAERAVAVAGEVAQTALRVGGRDDRCRARRRRRSRRRHAAGTGRAALTPGCGRDVGEAREAARRRRRSRAGCGTPAARRPGTRRWSCRRC